jgi:putative two-component system response regulator
VAIPDHILLKPGVLTPEEMAIMRTHTDVGADTIQSVVERTPGADFLEMAAAIARSHHEWYDGSGYPRGLSHDEIPVSARLVALADVYDALTTKRVYKEAFPHEKAVIIITELSGTHFDPVVVEAFLAQEHEFGKLASELVDDETVATQSASPEASDRHAIASVVEGAT